MTRTRGAWAAPVLAVLALTSGCNNPLHDETPGEPNGIATMSAPDAMAAMAKAVADRSDITFTGIESWQSLKGLPVTFSQLDNGRCEMVSISSKGRIEMRLLPRRMYVRVDGQAAMILFNVAAQPAKAIASKWIAQPVDAETRDDCNLAAELRDKKLLESMKAGEVTPVEKREVRKFSGRDEDGPITFYIATSGLPLPVQVTGQSKNGFYKHVLAGYDRGLVVDAPQDVIKAP